MIIRLLVADGSGEPYVMPDPKGRGGKVFLDGTVRGRFEELLGILEAHGAPERGVTAWARATQPI